MWFIFQIIYGAYQVDQCSIPLVVEGNSANDYIDMGIYLMLMGITQLSCFAFIILIGMLCSYFGFLYQFILILNIVWSCTWTIIGMLIGWGTVPPELDDPSYCSISGNTVLFQAVQVHSILYIFYVMGFISFFSAQFIGNYITNRSNSVDWNRCFARCCYTTDEDF